MKRLSIVLSALVLFVVLHVPASAQRVVSWQTHCYYETGVVAWNSYRACAKSWINRAGEREALTKTVHVRVAGRK